MHPVESFQKASYAVGNRLMPERTVQASPTRPNMIPRGHKACPGCGEVLGARYVLDAAKHAADGRLVVVDATGCLAAHGATSEEWRHSSSGRLAAAAAAVVAEMHIKGRVDVRVLAQAGDVASSDAGFEGLTTLFRRNDDILYVCYDNEGAMSATEPPTASRKDLPRIALASAIPYVATASIADLRDLEAKVMRAVDMRGARYLQIHVPCPVGWGAAAHDTMRLARLAIESGWFAVFEAQGGELINSRKIRHRIPVAEYLKPQKRFAHLFKDPGGLERLQATADNNIAEFHLLEGV